MMTAIFFLLGMMFFIFGSVYTLFAADEDAVLTEKVIKICFPLWMVFIMLAMISAL